MVDIQPLRDLDGGRNEKKKEHLQITYGQLTVLNIWASNCGGQVYVKGKIHCAAEGRIFLF